MNHKVLSSRHSQYATHLDEDHPRDLWEIVHGKIVRKDTGCFESLREEENKKLQPVAPTPAKHSVMQFHFAEELVEAL